MEKLEEMVGCLGDWAKDTDYVLCNGESDLLPTLYQKDEIRYTYNQYKNTWSYVSCTIFAAVGMASDQTNYEFSYDEIKEIDDTSYNNPDYAHIRLPWHWWYVSDAVDHIRKWWNKNEKLVKMYWKLASYRISKYSDELIEWAIEKLYTLDWNLCPNSSWNKDKADWMIDGTDFWKNTNWHSIDFICKEWVRSIKDSWSVPYYWLKHKLSEISNIWPNLYIYTLVKEDNLEEIKRLNEMKAECNVAIEHLQNLWHMTKDTNFQWVLHEMANGLRKKIEDCNAELKKYL